MSDWRLQGQQQYLQGLLLCWAAYAPYREGWDHDHCELCFLEFAVAGGDLTEGYTTPDQYRWICRSCFDDFATLFAWTVSPTEASA